MDQLEFLVKENLATIIVAGLALSLTASMMSIFRHKQNASAKKRPQPKWEVLSYVNVLVAVTFVSSFTYTVVHHGLNMAVLLNQADIVQSPMFPHVVLWCLCLMYFFGFFGISFIDKPGDSAGVLSEDEEGEDNEEKKQKGKKTQHTALNDTLTCAEKNCLNNNLNVRKPTHNLPPPSSSTTPPSSSSSSKTEEEEEVPLSELADEDILQLLLDGVMKDYQLEKKLGDHTRAVHIRRMFIDTRLGEEEKDGLSQVPYEGYDYKSIFGANCEIVIGYIPIPLGVVGPLMLDGDLFYVPMATTEGCLVASTNRGCKAIFESGGCNSMVLKDGITRAPCLLFPSAQRASQAKLWIEQEDNFKNIEAAFNSTTRFGRLLTVQCTVAGKNLFARFCCQSADAMGMNMVSKGCLAAIKVIEEQFPDMSLVAISGNMCTDKKPSAINWIEGRGKSIVVEAVIPPSIVEGVLKTTVDAMIATNNRKNMVGSAMAGSIGGFNAHAANILTAVFLACGQDPAQNVESSTCITLMEYAEDGESLHVSVTMPSVEVGTVGGGCSLGPQQGCLRMLGVAGSSPSPLPLGTHARRLATIIGGAVLAGELSLMAALAANHLVRSHMQHNRKPQTETKESK